VYDAAGRLVRTLVDEVQGPRVGDFEVEWNGRNNRGSEVASGVYYYRLVTGGFTKTRKMILLK
jgi:flagellar hook assembly protein FlgD